MVSGPFSCFRGLFVPSRPLPINDVQRDGPLGDPLGPIGNSEIFCISYIGNIAVNVGGFSFLCLRDGDPVSSVSPFRSPSNHAALA